ncbi:chloride channel protein CLC-f, partial [Tanacetum coccineum]
VYVVDYEDMDQNRLLLKHQSYIPHLMDPSLRKIPVIEFDVSKVGMAATLASVISLPLTSVLLLFELTKNYRILLPLMLCHHWLPAIGDRLQLMKEPLGVDPYEAVVLLLLVAIKERLLELTAWKVVLRFKLSSYVFFAVLCCRRRKRDKGEYPRQSIDDMCDKYLQRTYHQGIKSGSISGWDRKVQERQHFISHLEEIPVS